VIADGQLQITRWGPATLPRVATLAGPRIHLAGGSASASGGFVHVGSWDLTTCRWEDPLQPQPVRTNLSPAQIHSMAPLGSLLAANAGGYLQVYDLSDPGNPRSVGSQPRLGNGGDPLAGASGRLFWGATNAILSADLTDPGNPQVHEAALLDSPVRALGTDGHLLVAATDRPELASFRAGTDGRLEELGRQPLATPARSLAAVGGRLYSLSPSTGTLEIRSLSGSPPWPLLGRYSGGPRGQSLIVSPPQVYVGCGPFGIAVFDATDPANIRRIGGNSAVIADILVTDGRALLALKDRQTTVLPLVSDEPAYTLLGPAMVDGNFEFRLRGIPGSAATLQRAEASEAWESWQSLHFDDAAVVVRDPAPAAAHRLYRVTVP